MQIKGNVLKDKLLPNGSKNSARYDNKIRSTETTEAQLSKINPPSPHPSKLGILP